MVAIFVLGSSSNMGQFSRDVKMLAALGEDDRAGDKLLDATRKLCGAFSNLLNAAQPGSREVGAATCHQRLLSVFKMC